MVNDVDSGGRGRIVYGKGHWRRSHEDSADTESTGVGGVAERQSAEVRSRRESNLRWRRSTSCGGSEAQRAREGVESSNTHDYFDLDPAGLDLYLLRRDQKEWTAQSVRNERSWL